MIKTILSYICFWFIAQIAINTVKAFFQGLRGE